MFTTGGGGVSLLKLPICIQLEGTVEILNRRRGGEGGGKAHLCHKFQGTALQHVRAGRCRLKGENRRGPGRWYRTRPRRRPGQAVPAAHRGNLDGFPAAEKVCSCFIPWQGGGGLAHTRTHTPHDQLNFDIKLKKRRAREIQQIPRRVFFEGIRGRRGPCEDPRAEGTEIRPSAGFLPLVLPRPNPIFLTFCCFFPPAVFI